MSHTQHNASQRYVQPHVAGPYDPQLHQPHVPQRQVQQLHQGPSVSNTMPQVQPQHQYDTHNIYVHPSQPPSYDASFPALPERSESPWHKVEFKKRPRDNPESLTQHVKILKPNDYWLNPPSPVLTNKFASLSEVCSEAEGEKTPRRPPKAPPIFVSGVQNIQPLKELLVTVTENDFELKILNGDQVKIQPPSTDKYHTIIKALAEKHAEFHTYQPKENRSFRTVLRGMHYSTDTNDIKTELEKLGHKVVNIFNIKQIRTNIPLPLFFDDLKPSENNKDIYQIETLNYSKVKFEPPRKKRNIPQCSKCQRYGHTLAYCDHNPRCVKCAGNHPTKQCLRTEKSDAVKCVLCEGNHPANYKGCAVYKELQANLRTPARQTR